MNKEQVYDEEIYPLMAQIIAVCQEHKIAMLASFDIPTEEAPDLACTTHLPDESGRLPERFRQAVRLVKPSPLMLTVQDSAGVVTQAATVLP